MSEHLDMNDMYLFAKVVDHGGYSAASRALGIPTSKLSRSVSDLERQLGIHLLNRTTRSISLSSAGETFYRHCLALVGEAEAARESIEQTKAAPQGEIRVSCPIGLLLSDVTAILARFMGNNPEVRITLDATNRRVDVVDEGVDLAVRVRQPPLDDSELAVRVLGQSRMLLVCSQWFVAQHGVPQSVEELSTFPTLSMLRPGGKNFWYFAGADNVTLEVPHRPRLATDDLSSLLAAAVEGLGIALLPESLVTRQLADGRLQRLLPELRVTPGVVHVVFASRRGMNPAVRALLDALVDGFSAGAKETD